MILAVEADEEVLNLVTGNIIGKVQIPKEDRKSKPRCTQEGCNYVLECLPCRKQGKRRQYYGVTLDVDTREVRNTQRRLMKVSPPTHWLSTSRRIMEAGNRKPALGSSQHI